LVYNLVILSHVQFALVQIVAVFNLTYITVKFPTLATFVKHTRYILSVYKVKNLQNSTTATKTTHIWIRLVASTVREVN